MFAQKFLSTYYIYTRCRQTEATVSFFSKQTPRLGESHSATRRAGGAMRYCVHTKQDTKRVKVAFLNHHYYHHNHLIDHLKITIADYYVLKCLIYATI